MKHYLKLVLLVIQVYGCSTDSNSLLGNGDVWTKDTCNGETFQPSCSNIRDAILITSAMYGRMEVGSCIPQEEMSESGRDPKYFGCSSDVLDIMHQKCSLKQICQVKIPDVEMDKTKPCFSGLKLYLQTHYKCINVVDQDANCRIQATSNQKYLTVLGKTNSSQCGAKSRPWIVEASRGQKIKITLENLKKSLSDDFHTRCGVEIGYVTEKSYGMISNATLCSNGKVKSFRDIGHYEKERNEFVSASSVVELLFSKRKDLKSSEVNEEHDLIFIKIEAEGCLDIIPPEDTWLKRNGDEIVIGCYSSKQTWYLRCENRKWVGVVGNCSIEKDSESEINGITVQENELTTISEEQQIILFVAICALGVVICLVVVCIGAICIKKYSSKKLVTNIYNKQPTYYQSGQYSINRNTLSNKQQKCFPNYQQPFTDGRDNNHFLNGGIDVGKPEENKYFVLEADMQEQ